MLEKLPRATGVTRHDSGLVDCSARPLCSPRRNRASAGGVPSIEAKTSGMRHMPGFLPLHWDARNGRLYLEIPQLDVDMLYFDSLPYGTGSNDLGLDRGQVSAAKLVRFERFGPKILLVRPNENFRSSAPRSGRAAGGAPVLSGVDSRRLYAWPRKIPAPPGAGAVLVDATDFFLRDVAWRIRSAGEAGPL